MRDLRTYPVTLDEIEQCLLRLATEFAAEGRRGDMRPTLLRRAAKIVAASGVTLTTPKEE
jgi:hypothetical protein